jgi:signal transduction histidine kinase
MNRMEEQTTYSSAKAVPAAARASAFSVQRSAFLVVLTLAPLLAVGWIGAAQREPGAFVSYLLGGGLASLGLGAAGLLWLRRGRGPLWLQLSVTSALGVIVALVNIFLTARLMFFRESDLPLLVLLLLLAGAVSLALGAVLAGAITRRVSALHRGARALAGGDLAARVPEHGNDEIAGLAREFNRMAEQLAAAADERQRQEAARRDLVAAVSHDLRTPLASLRALTEAFADGLVEEPATRVRYLATMKSQIGLLSGLIDDLFELSQIDAGAIHLDLQRVAPADLLDDVAEGLRPQAAERGVQLEALAAAGTAPVLAAAQRIERVLANLVTNAIRHTPSGGTVALRASSEFSVLSSQLPSTGTPSLFGEAAGIQNSKLNTQNFVVFEVRDTGEGIPAEDLPHVFERFYRGEKSRSRATGGAGLGLAIARGIVEAHGGRIWAESTPGAGTTMRFTLPVAEAANE